MLGTAGEVMLSSPSGANVWSLRSERPSSRFVQRLIVGIRSQHPAVPGALSSGGASVQHTELSDNRKRRERGVASIFRTQIELGSIQHCGARTRIQD